MAVEIVRCRNSDGVEVDLPVTALALEDFANWKPIDADAKRAVRNAEKGANV